MDSINRASKLPLYQQLYELLRSRIVSGALRPGDLIAPEPELMASYGVSRATVRQVLDMLVREGLIYRERGRGSFVALPTLEKGMVRILSFTEDMRQRGLKPHTRILAAQLVPALADVAAALHVEPGEEMIRLERLRLAEYEPLAIEESYLIHRACPELLRYDLASEPLREILLRVYGIRWLRARQVIRAVLATGQVAHLLSVKAGSALLYIERVSYTQFNVPLEFLRIQYRGDRYSLYSELTG